MVSLPESLSISLPLEYGAHEEFEGATVEFTSGNLSLSSCLAVQTEHLPEFVLARSPWSVNLVSEDKDGTVGQLLVSQKRVQLNLTK